MRAQHLEAIGQPPGWEFYATDHPDAKRSSDLVEELIVRIPDGKYDVLIIDPLMEAYLVKAENDSVEANEQMTAFRRLARTTNAAVLLVHNTGKGNADLAAQKGKKFQGRGSSARADRADVVVNLTVEDDEERKLEIVKSRLGGMGNWITYRFGDELECELMETSEPRRDVVKSLIRECIELTRQYQPAEEIPASVFQTQLNPQNTPSKIKAIKRALAACVKDGELTRPQKGKYVRVPSVVNLKTEEQQDVVPLSDRANWAAEQKEDAA